MYSDDDLRSFDDETLRKLYWVYLRVGSIRGLVREIGCTYHYARTRIMMAEKLYSGDEEFIKKEPVDPDPPKAHPEVIDEIKDGQRHVSGRGIKTLEDLLSTAGVNSDEWIVTKYIVNKWDAVAKDGTTELFQVKAWLERRPDFFATKVKPVIAPSEWPAK